MHTITIHFIIMGLWWTYWDS